MNFLQRLFSQPKVEAMPADDPQTDGNIDETEQRQPSLLAPGLHVGKLTDIGQERKQNEDTFLVFDALIQHDYGQETFGLFIVADGMGLSVLNFQRSFLSLRLMLITSPSIVPK